MWSCSVRLMLVDANLYRKYGAPKETDVPVDVVLSGVLVIELAVPSQH